MNVGLHTHSLTTSLLCLQGDEEGEHRSGSGNGWQEAEDLPGGVGGPRADGKGRSGPSQFGCENLEDLKSEDETFSRG